MRYESKPDLNSARPVISFGKLFQTPERSVNLDCGGNFKSGTCDHRITRIFPICF